MIQREEGALEGFRVLDLTYQWGFLCGKVLGDLGADVIKIEPPGGDPSRNLAPFYKDIPDSEKSLYWFSYNSNKRGITLDISHRDGQGIFKKLVETADFLIETYPPGYMDGLGLGYSQLSRLNPRLVMTSITPFGQSGPYVDKKFKSPDLVSWALGGVLYMSGDTDRPPVRISGPQPQADVHAAAEAAAGTMIAHYYRQSTGEGQWVDVSVQQAVVWVLMNSHLFWDINRIMLKRAGSKWTGLSSNVDQPLVWPTKNGFITFALLGGKAGAKTNKSLLKWMEEEGMSNEFLRQTDWDKFDMAVLTQSVLDKYQEVFGKFFLSHTSEELFARAVRENIIVFPVNKIDDIWKDANLAARDFWVKVEHPELNDSISYPGFFAKFSETPIKIRRRAPLIGEHNAEIYEKELKIPHDQVIILKEAGVI